MTDEIALRARLVEAILLDRNSADAAEAAIEQGARNPQVFYANRLLDAIWPIVREQFEAGQESTRPLIERAQAAVQAHLAPHDPEWLAEHDRKVAHDAWEACSARWIELNPGIPVVPEADDKTPCCVGDDYCDSASSPLVDCTCAACMPDFYGYRLCQTCGNKRCPHAANHINECTHSNAPGQPGSSYQNLPKGGGLA